MKRAKLEIAPEVIAQALSLPCDVKIVSAEMENDYLVVVLEGAGLPDAYADPPYGFPKRVGAEFATLTFSEFVRWVEL